MEHSTRRAKVSPDRRSKWKDTRPPNQERRGKERRRAAGGLFRFYENVGGSFVFFLKIAGYLMVLFSGFCLVLCNSGSRRPLKGPCGEDPSEQNICVSLEEKTVKKKKRCNLELEQSKCSAR